MSPSLPPVPYTPTLCKDLQAWLSLLGTLTAHSPGDNIQYSWAGGGARCTLTFKSIALLQQLYDF